MISCEIARVYKQCRRGEMDSSEAYRLANVLGLLAKTMEQSAIEDRFAQLEFMRRLDKLEASLKLREPRQITITAHDDAEADEKIAAIHPPVTDADLVIVLRVSRAETIDTSDTITSSEPDAA